MKYVKIHGKSIKTNLKAKLNGDTMAKEQKSPVRIRNQNNIRPRCCSASKNIVL